MTWKTDEPFLLKPAFKDYLWGGDRLRGEYHKETDLSPLAESWECSTHPDGTSLALIDQKEIPMTEVLKRHPEILGTHPRTRDTLPILIKLIDAKNDLSVQVHPDDDYARIHEHGSLGKSEFWYVLEAEPGASLIYGFSQDVTEEQVRQGIVDGTIQKYLQKVPVRRNDVFFVQAGTVHAIGKGIVIAEIQESSNLTYRLYDYNRRDRNGNLRELHVEKALDVLNLHSSAEPAQPMRLLRYQPGYASELLTRCRYFEVERILLNTALSASVPYQTASSSFEVLMCVQGKGVITGKDFRIPFLKGSTIFLPADSESMFLSGKAELLAINC
ncbi:class I mannose-6-phosphate isomerase [Erysipelotrichaceae bacterium Oil+RF-744-GAM-WT-6]|uniref:Phosphohexomutase n=1 Tax=Stecheria intestinalis TaxID=2606630 RepID=A0A7X2NSD3_9FIRM|nr:type I phosphomannose isomerase catalytic subunit [Stecheria intestinalis]MSS58694.1 class I mannose-6-phosphate isomerase [Stecheria intestinalis]